MERPPRTCPRCPIIYTVSNIYSPHDIYSYLLQVRLTQEVAELQAHVSRLNTKLAEAEAAMKLLKNTKRELKEDLGIKALSLVIDRQKCMAIRLNFPYHTRCVCSTAKEDEAQVSCIIICLTLAGKVILFLILMLFLGPCSAGE